MGFGPLLIIDKSFLEMLNPEEVSELSVHFKLVGTPLLIREIISDLKKADRKDKRIPEKVVSALAAKMWSTHAVQPANFRDLVLSNVCTGFVPMKWQVPVDSRAPNVHVTPDGRGMIIDSTLEQDIWERWANGDFTTDIEQIAAVWRAGVQAINLHAVGNEWKEYAQERFAKARSLSELISVVDGMLNEFNPEVQRELLKMCLAFVNAPSEPGMFALHLFHAGLMPRLKDLAPYAASVLRLYLTFVGGLARGFIGPRPSNYIDLQYLFYAPFCMVFVSSDKFHREMWPATSGVNSFVWGPDLKSDLKKRVATGAKGEEAVHASEEDSIDALWRVYMRSRTGTKKAGPTFKKSTD
jgi:hypothetical protein